MVIRKLISTKRGWIFWTLTKMASNRGISSMRINYNLDVKFDINAFKQKEPINIFQSWFDEATKTEGIDEANAMTLATSTRNAIPSARIVLLKGYDKKGFKFFTNYESQKGCELEENPLAALVFFWQPLHRQIRIQGPVEKLTHQESTEYFHSRPRGSQIGACVSRQTSVIASRQVLFDKEKTLTEMFAEDQTIPKPEFWGGYRVIPNSVEFWHGRTNRLHERVLFRRKDELLKNECSETLVNWKEGDEEWMYAILSP